MTRLASAPATHEQDFSAARALIAEAEQADGTSPVSDQAMLAATQGQRVMLLFTEVGDAEAGCDDGSGAIPDRGPSAVGIVGQGEVDLVVRPESRGRGVGSAALDALLRTQTGELRAWAHGENPAAEALLRGAGFEPVRSLYRMVLDPELLPDDGRPPLALETPPDFALRAFDPESAADAEGWVRVNAAAFADHPEQGRISLADFALMRQEPWFDADDLILLSAGEEGELAGSTWIKTVRGESGVETELYAVGVDPAYAGRGLGGLLLEATLARMAQHSPDGVSLYVDGENERAVRLYERASFTIGSRSRQWLRPALSVPSDRAGRGRGTRMR
ncbi:MAG: mycothiol synthase [Leucobacter sp.]